MVVWILQRNVACVVGVRKGRGREIRARDHARQNSPFPFPFERLPRRLKEMLSLMLDIIHLESNKLGSC